jgi:hypothetical protein
MVTYGSSVFMASDAARTVRFIPHFECRAMRLPWAPGVTAALAIGTTDATRAPKGCIGEIRKALGDTPKTAHFIAMAHRRGYRFVAPVHLAAPRGTSYAVSTPGDMLLPHTSSLSHRSSAPAPVPLLERDSVLHRLHTALGHARAGACQVVFVTGEPGAGKTTVVEAFLAQAAPDPRLRSDPERLGTG